MNKDHIIGCDIVDIKRFRRLPYNKNRTFYHRWFTEKEIKDCLSKKNFYAHFASKFAAKEAAIKASQGKLSIPDIEVINKKTHTEIKLKREDFNLIASISHNKNYAIATVLGWPKK